MFNCFSTILAGSLNVLEIKGNKCIRVCGVKFFFLKVAKLFLVWLSNDKYKIYLFLYFSLLGFTFFLPVPFFKNKQNNVDSWCSKCVFVFFLGG